MSGYIEHIREKVGHDRLIVAGAGVVIYKDGQILLQKRKDDSCWALHGGGVESGEKWKKRLNANCLRRQG